jgi:amino acid permease
MFSILNEIKNNSHFRTTAVVVASIGTASFLYILVAITGYLSYGSNVQGNIVSMYPAAVASTIGRAAIVILVMFSYPLQVHPCRASVDAVLRWRPRGRTDPGNDSAGVGEESSTTGPSARLLSPRPGPRAGSQQPAAEITDTRFAILTSAIIIASYIVAMTVSSLEAVLAYVGSTGSTSISFILPGLFYYKISDPNSPHHQALLKSNDAASDDEDYDSDDGYADGDEQGHGGSGGALAASIGSLRSATRSIRRVGKKVWPRGMLRKLSLALAIYGILVMVVCLATNTFFLTRTKKPKPDSA